MKLNNISCNCCNSSSSSNNSSASKIKSKNRYARMCIPVWLYLGLIMVSQLQDATAATNQTLGLLANGAGLKSIPILITPPQCDNVRSLFEKRGISSSDVPNEPINGK